MDESYETSVSAAHIEEWMEGLRGGRARGLGGTGSNTGLGSRAGSGAGSDSLGLISLGLDSELRREEEGMVRRPLIEDEGTIEEMTEGLRVEGGRGM